MCTAGNDMRPKPVSICIQYLLPQNRFVFIFIAANGLKIQWFFMRTKILMILFYCYIHPAPSSPLCVLPLRIVERSLLLCSKGVYNTRYTRYYFTFYCKMHAILFSSKCQRTDDNDDGGGVCDCLPLYERLWNESKPNEKWIRCQALTHTHRTCTAPLCCHHQHIVLDVVTLVVLLWSYILFQWNLMINAFSLHFWWFFAIPEAISWNHRQFTWIFAMHFENDRSMSISITATTHSNLLASEKCGTFFQTNFFVVLILHTNRSCWCACSGDLMVNLSLGRGPNFHRTS